MYGVLKEAEHRSTFYIPYWNLPITKYIVPRQVKFNRGERAGRRRLKLRLRLSVVGRGGVTARPVTPWGWLVSWGYALRGLGPRRWVLFSKDECVQQGGAFARSWKSVSPR